jgi:hypothetical protein
MLQIRYDNKLRFRNNYAFVTISAAILKWCHVYTPEPVRFVVFIIIVWQHADIGFGTKVTTQAFSTN